MTTIHYPAKAYSDLPRQQLLQVAYALEDTRDRALRRLEAIEGKPGADWRDVIRAMRTAGLKLASTERISPRWRHRSITKDGFEQGDWAINTINNLSDQRDHWISLYGRDGWYVEMKNPTPAHVFAAARLVGLTGSES